MQLTAGALRMYFQSMSLSSESLDSIRSGLFLRTLALVRAGLSARAPWPNASDSLNDQQIQELKRSAQEITKTFGQLKGSVMKVGQLISVYGEYFLPAEVNSVFKELQFQTQPLDWSKIAPLIKAELGEDRFNELEFETQAFACASLGQVHRARHKTSGQMLAVKAQYPGVQEAVDTDLRTLRMLLQLTRLSSRLPRFDSVYEEIREMLDQELDYRTELKHLVCFQEALKSFTFIEVPAPWPEFCSQRVLTTELREGARIDSPEVFALSQERRNRLGEQLLHIYFSELFTWRAVQTDPHCGNFRVAIDPKGQFDKWILYDFGAVRRISKTFSENYRQLVMASADRNQEGVLRAASQLGFLSNEDSTETRTLLTEFCFLMLEPFSQPKGPDPLFDWRTSDLPKRVAQQLQQLMNRFSGRSPVREVLFIDRKTSGVFILLSVLGAKTSGAEILSHYRRP